MQLQEFMANNTPQSLFNIMADDNQLTTINDFVINFTHNLMDNYAKKEIHLTFDFSNEMNIINIKSAIYKVIDKYKTYDDKVLTNFNQELSRAIVTTIFDIDSSNKTSYFHSTINDIINSALRDISKYLNLDKNYIMNFPLSSECYADILNAYVILKYIKKEDVIGSISYDMINNEKFCHEFKKELEINFHIHNIISAIYDNYKISILFIDNNDIVIKNIDLPRDYKFNDYVVEAYKLILPKIALSKQLVIEYIAKYLICDVTTAESIINDDNIGRVIRSNYYGVSRIDGVGLFKDYMVANGKLTKCNNLLYNRDSVEKFTYQHGGKNFKFLLWRSNQFCIWYIGDNGEILKYNLENGHGITKIVDLGMERLINNKFEGKMNYISKSIKSTLHFKIGQAANAITNGDLSKLTNFKFEDIVNYLKK